MVLSERVPVEGQIDNRISKLRTLKLPDFWDNRELQACPKLLGTPPVLEMPSSSLTKIITSAIFINFQLCNQPMRWRNITSHLNCPRIWLVCRTTVLIALLVQSQYWLDVFRHILSTDDYSRLGYLSPKISNLTRVFRIGQDITIRLWCQPWTKSLKSLCVFATVPNIPAEIQN